MRAINGFARRVGRRATCASLLLLTFFFTAGAVAQTTTTTTRATDGHTPLEIAPGSPAGSYALSDFDNISLFSQSLGFRLPLLRVGGRGEAGYTITLPIERKWRITHKTVNPAIGCQSCDNFETEHHYLPESNWYTALKPGFSPGVMIVRMAGLDPLRTSCGGAYLKTLARLTFVAPDGTEYELRDTRFNGSPRPALASCTEGENRGRIFVTTDGTAATFVADADIKDYTFPLEDQEQVVIAVSGYLYLRDGTRYHVKDNVVDVIRDRNGNEVRFYASWEVPGQPGVFYQRAVDSVGREVLINMNTNEISFKGFGGAARTLRVLYAPMHDRLRQANNEHGAETIKQRAELFPSIPYHPQDVGFNGQDFDDPVVSEVVLPDNRRYGFRYNSYGELARVELPTGGAFEYDYQADPGVINMGEHYEIFRRVERKRVYREGGQLESVMTFSGCSSLPTGSPNSCVQVDQLDPNSGPGTASCAQPVPGTSYRLLSRTRHHFHGVPGPGLFTLPTHYTGWGDGREFRAESYACDGTTLLRQVDQEWRQKGVVGWWVNYGVERGPEPSNDPRLVETLTTLSDTGQVAKTTSISPLDNSVGFDQYNNPTDVWEYDYGASTPLRHAKTQYLTTSDVNSLDYTGGTSPTPAGAYLRGLPLQKSVYEVHADLGEVERSRVRYEYDNYADGDGRAPLTPRPGIFALCLVRNIADGSCQTLSSTDFTARGNVTATTSYLLADDGTVAGSITTHAQYDVAGNVVKTIDGRGQPTAFGFADRYGGPDGDARLNPGPTNLDGQSATYARPTAVTDALGHTARSQFDYFTGEAVDTEDINGVVTSSFYQDTLDRLTKVVRAVGVAETQSQTVISYDDANRSTTTTSDLNAFTDGLLKSQTLYDGLGRTVESRAYESATTFIRTTQAYDALGRVGSATNPYRTLGDTTYGVRATVYDALGRVRTVTTSDGSTIQTDYVGAKVLLTDQAGKQRLSQSNALGQLTDVWEIRPADASTVAVTFGGQTLQGYLTHYGYDALGNLKQVTQGAQTRTFAYDSLSRLTAAASPEGGTVQYRYDANGNVVLKIDPRPRSGGQTLSACSIPYQGTQIATCTEYDPLNRVQSLTYNDGTPNVAYAYDNVANGKGRLVSVGNSVSTYTYASYDALGRVKSSSQTTDGVTYSMPDYRYDLAGNLTSAQYPSGRVVKAEYDAAGRLAGVRNHASGLYYAGAGAGDAANRIQYTAGGAASAVKLGNSLWEHTSYNSRLQPTQIGLGTSAANSSKLQLDYAYGTDDSHNNGNLRTQTITVPGMAQPYVQTYGYDELNRLSSATEMNSQLSSTAPTWRQVFSYDRYGNRNFAQGTTSPDYSQTPNDPATGLPVDPVRNTVFDPANNQIKATTAGQGAYAYDAAGNLLCEPGRQCAQTPYYDYDAENRMKSAGGGYAGGGTSYTYDGGGRRVKKATFNGEVTVFVYDAAGRPVAEYSNQVQANGTRYLTQDNLGSTRVVTDALGNAHAENGAKGARHDYLPFGEELSAGAGGRTTVQGYSPADGVRQKFAGSERDAETTLDFMQARYYASPRGRFQTPDPYNVVHEKQYAEDDRKANELLNRYLLQPMHWNRYAYALNNPLRYVDPSGEKEEEIVVRVNIVYDKTTISSEEEARKLTAATVADATKVYATAGIKLEVTYTAGTATGGGKVQKGNSITEGKVEGAVNIFVSRNRSEYTGGVSNYNTGESFINYGSDRYGTPRNPGDDILTHELGHQFGVITKASWWGSLADDYNNWGDDSIINSTNDSLRKGSTTELVIPTNMMGGLDNSGARANYRRIPTIDVYREHARRFAKK
ncbi:MAG TPA: RHS repeat-associated core domain-containing protein [Pyrinomonadaceae bacterium]